jgi:putative flavoprotein involved in K+ transport
MRRTKTIIIGAGQAGLSLSRSLSQARHHHVVLERDRIGAGWLERWDSLALLTPNWLNRLDGGEAHADVEGFLSAADFAAYVRRYARSSRAPVHERAAVTSVEPKGDGFEVRTEAGRWLAKSVVVATGWAAEERVPESSRSAPRFLRQLHSSRYRSPAALPPGGVLVVGAGPSGQQIAAELRRSGRRVVLAVGTHNRSMRRYRGRDIWHWLREIGDLDRTADEVGPGFHRGPSLALSGANGGEQLDLAVLDQLGVTIAGRLLGFDASAVSFDDDLQATAQETDLAMRGVLDRIDDHIAAAHPEWPFEPNRVADVRLGPGPSSLELAQHEVSTVIWATGYRRSYPWLHVPALGADGEIEQLHGVSRVPGLYTLGMSFQRHRASHFIGGVGADAALLARQIVGAEVARRESTRWRLAPVPRLVPAGYA